MPDVFRKKMQVATSSDVCACYHFTKSGVLTTINVVQNDLMHPFNFHGVRSASPSGSEARIIAKNNPIICLEDSTLYNAAGSPQPVLALIGRNRLDSGN